MFDIIAQIVDKYLAILKTTFRDQLPSYALSVRKRMSLNIFNRHVCIYFPVLTPIF